ncbi:tumor necrosis factor receptor superfamily member 16 [Takifugu rubripes]|uniref:Neurotrophin receptor associated death domain n=1 Tax=Takifugu rubripes TaxID=31033 RepID=A0A674N920_TAKRU|nr:tumor necrosis factor receptor superfamily member 16-like [Takifugu rubripes]|eukprot:XP_011603990.1 PREDICTED: tumor necrosis factor receptor superfamily member 16-like [Takifugu rubripes]
MRLFVICGLLLVKVAVGDACPSGQFSESGQCCSLCPAGFGVVAECGKADTKCAPCPQGTFSSSEGLGPCQPCAKCPLSVPMLASCTATENTQCECDSGYFFWGVHGLCAPCSKCTRGEGAVRECGPKGDTLCQICGPGTFSEELRTTKPCQVCAKCSDSEVEIRACLPNSDTLCMDKQLDILSRPVDGTSDASRWPILEDVTKVEASPTPGTPKFTPQEESGSNNILAYVSVLAAVVLGLFIYVGYKCWRSCKQKRALSKARAAELSASPEGEKLQSDSGVFVDSHSLHDNQTSKGTNRDSKQDNRLYINLPPHRQEEVEHLLQEGGGRGWRQVGAALGYEPEQLDLFGHGEAPARTLLSNWAQKEGSTLGSLCSVLARVERPDVVAALNRPGQGVSLV